LNGSSFDTAGARVYFGGISLRTALATVSRASPNLSATSRCERPLDRHQPSDLSPLLQADHTLLLADRLGSSEGQGPTGQHQPPHPGGLVFNRRRWPRFTRRAQTTTPPKHGPPWSERAKSIAQVVNRTRLDRFLEHAAVAVPPNRRDRLSAASNTTQRGVQRPVLPDRRPSRIQSGMILAKMWLPASMPTVARVAAPASSHPDHVSSAPDASGRRLLDPPRPRGIRDLVRNPARDRASTGREVLSRAYGGAATRRALDRHRQAILAVCSDPPPHDVRRRRARAPFDGSPPD
jgi:hypothetical protein